MVSLYERMMNPPKKRKLYDTIHYIELTCIIYGYKRYDTWVYIGQTRQTLESRDVQHKTNGTATTGSFDHVYTNDVGGTISGPFILEEKVHTYDVTSQEDQAIILSRCQEWMNEREIYWIRYHKTYEKGLNRTKGGQNGVSVSFFLAMLKKAVETFTSRNMPAFRRWCTDNQNQPICKIPKDCTINGINIGSVLSHMRTGNTSIPNQFLKELNELGYNDGKKYQDCQWEHEYMPTFRQWCTDNRNQPICKIPQDCTINGINIGYVLHSMRSGNTFVPNKFMEKLNDLGYNDGKKYQDCRWDHEYMPAFRQWCTNNQNQPICKIPQDCIINGINIGSVLHNMRRGRTSIPNQFLLKELNELGYNDGKKYQDCRWDHEYMPAFRQWCTNNQNQPICKIPIKCKINNTLNIGTLLYRIRTYKVKVPGHYLQELNAMGLHENK